MGVFGRIGLVHAALGVPAKQQAELLAKAGKYDRQMVNRAVEGRLRIVMAARTGSSESREFSLLARKRLAELGRIGELELELEAIEVERATDLAPRLHAGDVAIAYLSTGLRSHVAALADQLGGRSVLTVAAAPEYVELGAVLGFDLVNGSPSLLVNLRRARSQRVEFHASFLKLASIIE